MIAVKRALVSVYDKTGIVDFSAGLQELGIEIVSTGGTAKLLKEAGFPVRNIFDFTGFPELLDGRVKTLHPRVHGALLALRESPEQMKEVAEHKIELIDMVVVNLYPFAKTIAKEKVTMEEAIENIDIGGPAMIRSAAKNYKNVAVIVDPSEYKDILEELRANRGTLSTERSLQLAVKAFQYTADYDRLIHNYLYRMSSKRPLIGERFPQILNLRFEKIQDLRYGENPYQKAAFYRDALDEETGLAVARQLQGKELSFNNIMDLNAAFELVREFEEPTAVIIKHTNPCGAACGGSLVEAYKKAKSADPVSAFGGIIGLNREVDEEIALELAYTFLEAIIAPGFSPEALKALKTKQYLRLLEKKELGLSPTEPRQRTYDLKKVVGGLLIQDKDAVQIGREDLKAVTKRAPTEGEFKALLFAWKVVKHVKSNAIVLALGDQTVGVGAGQMSRIDAVRIAIAKAGERAKNAVLASDAFFPFRDGVDEVAKVGVTAIIQPGGSVSDQEVIEAANEHNIAMVFTGVRHFKH